MLPETIVIINSDGSSREMTAEAFRNIITAKLRKTVSGEGRITAKCIARNTIVDSETGESRVICNFNAISTDQVEVLKEHMANGEYQEALNVGLSTSFREGTSQFIPSVGEICSLSLANVPLRSGKEGLRVVGVALPPQAETKALNFDALFGTASAPSSEPDFDVATADKDQLLAKAQELNLNVSAHLTSAGVIKTQNVDKVRAVVAAAL